MRAAKFSGKNLAAAPRPLAITTTTARLTSLWRQRRPRRSFERISWHPFQSGAFCANSARTKRPCGHAFYGRHALGGFELFHATGGAPPCASVRGQSCPGRFEAGRAHHAFSKRLDFSDGREQQCGAFTDRSVQSCCPPSPSLGSAWPLAHGDREFEFSEPASSIAIPSRCGRACDCKTACRDIHVAIRPAAQPERRGTNLPATSKVLLATNSRLLQPSHGESCLCKDGEVVVFMTSISSEWFSLRSAEDFLVGKVALIRIYAFDDQPQRQPHFINQHGQPYQPRDGAEPIRAEKSGILQRQNRDK